MDIKILKASILQNNIPNFMVFIVEEQALAKQYIQSISTTLNKHYKYYTTADEVLYETSTNLKDDYVYIILNDTNILKNEQYFKELSNLDRTVILYFNEFDFKSSLYKNYSNYFVKFEKLDAYTILAYLLKKLKDSKIEVDQEKLLTLINYCDNDLGKCLNELDKIITLGQTSSNAVFDYMLARGFSDYRTTNLFRFVQKILNKDLEIFDDYQRLPDPPISILATLYNAAKTKILNSNKDTNLKYYIDILKLCFDLDTAIKSGTINDTYVIDYLLLEILK